jgi:hypothetical protein
LQWSSSENEQAAGRIYRQGQTRPVTIYTLLAKGTIDYVVWSLAQSKGSMLESFLGPELSEKQKRGFLRYILPFNSSENHFIEFIHILAGGAGSQFVDEDSEDEDYEEKKPAKSNKRTSKKQGEGSKKKKPRTIKSSALVEDANMTELDGDSELASTASRRSSSVSEQGRLFQHRHRDQVTHRRLFG